MDQTRRTILIQGVALALLACEARAETPHGVAAQEITAIERDLGGRIGVAVLDKAGALLLHRPEEVFPMCSTFKLLAAAAILKRADEGALRLDETVAYTEADLVAYSPVTEPALRLEGGAGRLSLEALCAAAMTVSDNTAANLLLRTLDGPPALTAWLRGIGDPTTRLDRTEPTLNTAIPDDPRDTTSPAAMAITARRLLLGDGLKPESRDRLEAWMVAARTGTRRLRAGLPADWIVGDKTGSGDNGTANVVALLRPPNRLPLLAAIFMTGSRADAERRDAAHARIGRIIATGL